MSSLIAKWGQKSVAAKFLIRCMSEDKKSEALGRIKKEIKVLYEQMATQQTDDAESRTWCQKKDDSLALQIDDLQIALTNLISDKEAATTQASHHRSESERAAAVLVQLQESSVADAKQLQIDVKENVSNISELTADVEACAQAKVALSQAFKGRTDESGREILRIIEDVIADYNKAIRIARDVTRSLAAEKRQQEEVFATQSSLQKGLAKKHLTSHDKFSDDAMRFEEKLRYARRELDMAKDTRKRIFVSEDGKCHKYNDVYPSRIADRKVEMENLHNAQEALNSYMQSLGIRVQ